MPAPLENQIDKQKALLCAKFVQATYAMFKNPGVDPLRPEPLGIPPGYEVGAWIHMCDFILNLEQPMFYGIVAHEQENPDSRVIAIRGTEGAIEWIDDSAAVPVPFRQVPSAGRVACGFDRIYSSLKVVKRPIAASHAMSLAAVTDTFSGSFAEQLEQLAMSHEAERGKSPRTRPTIVTGHSLGAALTTLFVMENAAKRKFDVGMLYTFASPRVGDTEFAHTFNQLPISSWRVVNKQDIVPKLPLRLPIVLDYEHVNTLYEFDSSDFARNNLVCWHSMETYMHGLDPSSPLLPECTGAPNPSSS